jgi:phage terminase large subunit-like protein
LDLPKIAGFDPNTLMGDKFEFDRDLARKACDFFPQVLRHTKNSRFTRAGDPFELNEWQQVIVLLLFGVVDKKTRLRRFRTAYIEVPRKNGKTTLAAGIALYGLFADGESGAEVYCAAASRDQASLLFDISANMVKKAAMLAKSSTIKASIKRIVYLDSYMRAVASDAHSLHGQNAHLVLADEVHAWANGGHDLWDVLETGTASRGQSLMCGITTAGHDQQTKCYELHCYAKNVRDGKVRDDSFLPVIFGAEPEDDWKDPEIWKLANPNLGVSIPVEYLERQCAQAIQNRSFENAFRRLHLNQWTSQHSRWLSMDAWRACEA